MNISDIVFGALKNEYDFIFLVNTETEEVEASYLGEIYAAEAERLNENRSFAACVREGVETTVHPEDREYVNVMLSRENVRSILSERNSFAFSYRVRTCGEPRYMTCRITKAEKPYFLVCIGETEPETVSDIRERDKHRGANEENRKLLESLMKEHEIVYRVCLTDGSFTQIRMDDSMVGAGLQFSNFKAAVNFFLSEVAYYADREALRRELDFNNIRRRLANAPSFSMEYRAVVEGVPLWHNLFVCSLGYDDVAVAFTVRDGEILREHIAKVLMDSYEGLYVINFTTDQIKVLKSAGKDRKHPATYGNDAFIRQFANRLREEDRAGYLAAADPEHELEVLRREGSREFFYRSPDYPNEDVWVKNEAHVLSRVGGMPETVAVAVSRVDSLQKERIELSGQLKKALDEARELQDRSAFVRDLVRAADWSFRIDENDELTGAEFYGNTESVLGMDLTITPHAWEEILHPEDRDRVMQAFYAAVRDRTGATPYDVTYRMRDKNGDYNRFRSAGKIFFREDGSREFFGIHIRL